MMNEFGLVSGKHTLTIFPLPRIFSFTRLNRYASLEDGGWWVSGLDPLHNWKPMQWGRYKPDNPRIIGSTSKPIKYESPPKVGNRVTYFDVPQHIWDRVAKRYGIKRYHSPLAQRLTARTKPL